MRYKDTYSIIMGTPVREKTLEEVLKIISTYDNKVITREGSYLNIQVANRDTFWKVQGTEEEMQAIINS